MPRLSLGLGVSSSSKLPSAAAPSGIPVAGTNSIIVNGEVLQKSSSTKYDIYTRTEYDDSGQSDISNAIVFDSVWKYVELQDGYILVQIYSTTNSNNPNFIPTTGWSPAITITAPTFPNVATTSTVNALINTSDADLTSYLQSVGFAAVGGVFSVPLTKLVPPSQPYLSVEYKTTFSDGGFLQFSHSTAGGNRWFLVMEQFTYNDEEYGAQYSVPINIYTAVNQSNATIPAARSTYSGTNINSMVSPNCFS